MTSYFFEDMRYPNSLLAVCLLAIFYFGSAQAQTTDYRPIATAVPSLRISPDARSASLGDIGVATSPDVYAQYWSSAKYAFAPSRAGVAFSYTPWLRQLTEDMALMQASFYTQIGTERRHSLGASLRYFSIGKLSEWNEYGQTIGEGHPYELAVDLGYAYRLSRYFSIGAAVRYTHTDYALRGSADRQSALSADLSSYGQIPIELLGQSRLLRIGASLRNLGGKISYDSGASYAFLPTTLSLGAGIGHEFDKDNSLMLDVQMDKLLVPVFPNADMYSSTTELQRARSRYYGRSSLSSMLHSFTDAPGGLSEELKEIRWGMGLEYAYRQLLFLRLGYSYQHPDKGNLQALNLGAGLHWKGITLDLAYLLSTSSMSPQDKTFRCSLGVDLEAIKRLLH